MRKNLFGLAAAALLAAAAPALAVEIGEAAPPLEIKDWVQGGPVDLASLAGKKFVVVEIWATWCGPCKTSIPHLSKLAEKYRTNLEIVGISDESAEEVKTFAQDGKFKYCVASDVDKNTTGPYMGDRKSIPQAFLVDQKGVVAWVGHPMALDGALEKLMAGKWDIAKAKEADAARKELQHLAMTNTRDPDQYAAVADKILAADPADENAFDLKCDLLKNKKNDKDEPDFAPYKAFIAGILPKIEGDWRALNNVAWRLATDDGLPWRDIGAAFKAAKKSVELSQSKEANPLDTLARVYFEAGLLDQAIDTQKKAIAVEEKPDGMKKTLAYYESCADLRKQVGGSTPAKKK